MANLIILQIEFIPEDPRKTFQSIRDAFLFDDGDEGEIWQFTRNLVSTMVKHVVEDWEARNFVVNIPANQLYSEVGLSENGRERFARKRDPFEAAQFAMNCQPEARQTQELDIAEMKYAVHRWGTFA